MRCYLSLKSCPSPAKDLEDRETSSNEPVHVINVEIKDNHECATIGAQHIVKLAALVCLGLR